MNKDWALKENRIHGDPNYPASVYAVRCPPEERLLDLHWHEELEFLMITEGEAKLRIGARDYFLKTGEAVFVNAGELHSGQVAGGNPCSFLAVVFHASLLGSGPLDVIHEQYLLPLIRKAYRVPVHITLQSEPERELLAMLRRLFQAGSSREPALELTVKGLLCLAVSGLIGMKDAAEDEGPSGGGSDERLKAAIIYIEQHYSEPITLKSLAEAAAMNESYFCRFFRRMTSMTPVKYMNLYRVRQASLLLQRSDKKVMEIALNTGFNSLSYFNVMFKQHFGCTPAAYRKRARKSPSGSSAPAGAAAAWAKEDIRRHASLPH
ncbi:AraC-type DNA-binding protein [Paenibacillus sp. UNCCL117]|uniref:AraC family transcriptional regulator n=1 Tax=unclassified Paenibacillus TaxID=185978 RepID=UPI00088A9CBC|nr:MULTISPECIES: AraC family transcriptional regulator [unclassified Paenibacillus]SDD90001.1 AraC-type DNA-binding protein [Paenibacillus sp. cl123]SFW44026.1 AraC-type DNA-binding protein [Paenibacillus sp. UNCCL117]